MMSFRLTVAVLAAGVMIASPVFAETVKPGATTPAPAPAAPAPTPAAPAPAGGSVTVKPGAVIVVPATPAPPAAVVAVALPRVNINDPFLTVNQVAQLKGAGNFAPQIFAKIKASVAANGAFIYKEDLVKRGIVPAPLFAQFKAQVVLVDINNTCKTDLHAILDGIGPAKADAIWKERIVRPFGKIEDIMNVSGIGQGTFDSIADEITVTPRSGTPWPCLAK
jgi:competence protein ComEA